MKESPDLVISGINGGPNLGQDWFGSGTIGAARTASFAGVPAIAVSGLDDDHLEAVQTATRWVVRLAQSRLVQQLKPPQYLTVSIPRISPGEIRGIRVAKRAGVQRVPTFKPDRSDSGTEDGNLWRLSGMRERDVSLPADCDVSLYAEGYVVIVPMTADEHDRALPHNIRDPLKELPAWE
jgi:5'-nucleotidase